ncbi:S9 family peptidase [Methanosphaera sp. WGK6]|uniref:alpha/beta hydrolase family protein n=1 Tax=Methanosphaera sp. WGK6 TaxID=1561964 RepID=UPI00084CBBEB|nr:alpha/beta fold hydrolase [Methanosphaera sp. WGK6]
MIKEANCTINNENIYGLLYLPDNIDDKIPLVVLSHGLSLNHTFMKAYAEKLLKKGIASYIFDFRGGGYGCMSDGKISDMSLLTEIDDLNTVMDYIKSLDYVDENKIYLAGHSQGGLISSLVAPRRSDVRAMFLFAPAYVIVDDVLNMEDMREKSVMTLMPEHTGKTYIEGAKSINLYDDIKDYSGRVYLFHGGKDTRVPLNYVVEADKIYSNSTLFVFDDEEHRFTDSVKDLVIETISQVISRD